MVYNHKLAERIRNALAHEDVTEKKMFGGICFMVSSKMCICVGGGDTPDQMMVRVGPKLYEEALKKKEARPVIMRGHATKGYIDLTKRAIKAEKDFAYWIDLALEFNRELTGKNKTK